MTKRLLAVAALAAAMIVPSTASAATVASFNGCTYYANSYVEAAQKWIDAGFPSCGRGYVTSVSLTTTVSGTVNP